MLNNGIVAVYSDESTEEPTDESPNIIELIARGVHTNLGLIEWGTTN